MIDLFDLSILLMIAVLWLGGLCSFLVNCFIKKKLHEDWRNLKFKKCFDITWDGSTLDDQARNEFIKNELILKTDNFLIRVCIIYLNNVRKIAILISIIVFISILLKEFTN